MKKARKPSDRRIKQELRQLREMIETSYNDPIRQRLAQVAEDAIRWVTEETDWDGPTNNVENFARILDGDMAASR